MIAPCRVSPNAAFALRLRLGVEGSVPFSAVEVEFREVPYFLVSRSQAQWSTEQGDINEVNIIGANDTGLIVDPEAQPLGDDPNQARRHTLVPWANVISLSITRSSDDAGGTQTV